MGNELSTEVKMFGAIIRQTRIRSKISQEKLGENTGLHRSYISDVERGLRNISIKNIFRICNALNVNPSDVFIQVEETQKNEG